MQILGEAALSKEEEEAEEEEAEEETEQNEAPAPRGLGFLGRAQQQVRFRSLCKLRC